MDRANRYRRLALGILTLVLLLGAGISELVGEGGPVHASSTAIAWRLAVVTGLWWLAYPEILRLPRKFWWGLVFLIAGLLFGPKRVGGMAYSIIRWWPIFLPIIGVLTLLWYLRPKQKK